MVSFGAKDLDWVVNYVCNQKNGARTVERFEKLYSPMRTTKAKARRVSTLKRAPLTKDGTIFSDARNPAPKALG